MDGISDPRQREFLDWAEDMLDALYEINEKMGKLIDLSANSLDTLWQRGRH